MDSEIFSFRELWTSSLTKFDASIKINFSGCYVNRLSYVTTFRR